jgi:hypothetical protein
MSAKLYDKTGREIMVGDVLKVFHFIHRVRKERCFMHKWVDSLVDLGPDKKPFFKISHLDVKPGFYHERIDGRHMKDVEIVQGFGTDGLCWRDRPRIKAPPPQPSDAGRTP